MVNRLMALALRFQDLLSHGIVRNRAELAELGQVSRVRVCQILLLTNLAPTIHETLLCLPKTVRGRDRMTEHRVRDIANLESTGRRRCSCFVPASPASRSSDVRVRRGARDPNYLDFDDRGWQERTRKPSS